MLCIVPLVSSRIAKADEQHNQALSLLEQRLHQEGLISVQTLDPSIVVDLKYAKVDNFMKTNIYHSLSRAYLRPAPAEKLVRANQILKERHPHLRILVGDAVRPLSVQKEMWKLVAGTTQQPYVANPKWGSMHNYGAAVDVTLFDVQAGKQLDMGTPLDYFGPLAQPLLENRFLQKGELNASQLENRLILRKAMLNAGWHTINIEWWHFNAFPKAYIRKNYSKIK
ncbi:MAG: M15 family metallopeptidase [Desulforhopalus sp.]